MTANKELQSLVQLFHVVGKLKIEKRKGWVDRAVKQPESVADHCFRLALMAMVFAERQQLDCYKTVKMALVHDLAEAECGDIATRLKEEWQEVSNSEKHKKEKNALEKILRNADSKLANEIRQLWQEFEARTTDEARLLYELDRLEAIFQAVEYEKEGNFRASLQEFFDYANARLRNPELRKVFAVLMHEREKK